MLQPNSLRSRNHFHFHIFTWQSSCSYYHFICVFSVSGMVESPHLALLCPQFSPEFHYLSAAVCHCYSGQHQHCCKPVTAQVSFLVFCMNSGFCVRNSVTGNCAVRPVFIHIYLAVRGCTRVPYLPARFNPYHGRSFGLAQSPWCYPAVRSFSMLLHIPILVVIT